MPDAIIAFCVLLLLVIVTIFVVRMTRGIDIEYCGGPEDGRRTVSLYKEETIETYSKDYSIVYKYICTDEYTKEAHLKYQYVGRELTSSVKDK